MPSSHHCPLSAIPWAAHLCTLWTCWQGPGSAVGSTLGCGGSPQHHPQPPSAGVPRISFPIVLQLGRCQSLRSHLQSCSQLVFVTVLHSEGLALFSVNDFDFSVLFLKAQTLRGAGQGGGSALWRAAGFARWCLSAFKSGQLVS